MKTLIRIGGWLSRFGRWLYELAMGTPRDERSYAPISHFIGKRLQAAGYPVNTGPRWMPGWAAKHFWESI